MTKQSRAHILSFSEARKLGWLESSKQLWLFVFVSPIIRVFTFIIASFFGVQASPLIGRFITSIIATVQVFIFGSIGKHLGGASFNPSTTLSFYAAGLNPGASLISMAVQFPAQAAGGVGGAKAILQVMPKKYEHFVKGPSLKVEASTGAVAEGLFAFCLCFGLLWVMLRSPKNLVLQIWLLKVATVGLAIVGSGDTGPSMNPANAFGWAYVDNWHNTWEQFFVYWIGSLIGAILAGRVFMILYPLPEKKEKKA